MKPRNNYVLVTVDAVEEKTKVGILLSQNSQEDKHTGTVEAIGPGAMMLSGERNVIDLKPGDKVRLRDKNIGFNIDKTKRLYLFNEVDILATL
jgi:co-chaperonin GroES (HSP10)